MLDQYPQHPIAEQLQFVSDSLLEGAADELPYWGLLHGVDITYIDGLNTSDGTSLLQMMHGDWKTVEYQFKPQPNIANPLTVLEEENGSLIVHPVQARLFMSVAKPPLVRIGVKNGARLEANSVQVDVLKSGMVLSVNETLQVNPILGEYDSNVYQFIGSKIYEDLRLGHLLRFMKDFLRS